MLQSREARNPFRIEAHHFTIDDAIVERQRFHRARDLGKDIRIIVPVPREKQGFAVRLARDQPISVELELEEPVVASERRVRGLAVHRFHRFRVDVAAHRLFFAFECFADLGTRTLARLYFFDGETREHRLVRKVVGFARRTHPRIALLDQQPIFFGFLDLHQRPLSVELVTLELEQKLPLLQSFTPRLDRHPLAAVPHDHAARAIVPRRDHALEISVLERMVFDFHRQPLLGLVVRRPLRHRPRTEDAVHLQPQIEMEIPRRVLVNDEEVSGNGRDRPERLGRPIGRTFGTIATEAVARSFRVTARGHRYRSQG